MSEAGAGSSGPLAGIKILDLSRLLPGPFATLVLGDLGATVDKVEDTGPGDYLRYTPPLVGDTSATFLALNRNKRSVCLDLKKELGRTALMKLVERYDVLFEQFRPGVLDRLGVGHTALMARNPRLVVCSLTGYGQTGPLARRAGHDVNYLARSGVLGMQGPPGAPPQLPGFQLADFASGLWSAIGIMAALQERAVTGRGRTVDVSMVESSMGFALAGFGALFGGHEPVRGDEPLTGGLALYGTYATKDGRSVAFGALEPKFFAAFSAGVGLAADGSAHVPGPHQAGLRDCLRDIFASRTRDEWEAFARAHDCCLEPVLEPGETLDDEQLRSRGVFFEMDSPWGTIRQLATPLMPRGKTHAPPPRRGEHTDTILREGGIDEATIAAMHADGSAG